MGRDVIRGYGSALLPLSAGHHILDIPMYTPLSSSILTEWAAWLWGNPPEVSSLPPSRLLTGQALVF
jgi:hypothetical protein